MGFIAVLLETCSLLVLLSAEPEILFANRKDLRLVGVNPNDTLPTSTIVINNLEDAAAVDFLYAEGIITWTDVSLETIKTVHYTKGSVSNAAQDIVTTGLVAPDGLACDWISRKLYWADSDLNRIEVSELDGSSRKVLFWEGLDQPRAIALDPHNGYFYWTDWGDEAKIERATMDGLQRTVIIDENIYWPNGLTIDYESHMLYWADAKRGFIHRCNLDGSNRTEILSFSSGLSPHPFAMTLYKDKIYWTDWDKKAIISCDKLTGQNVSVVIEGLYYPMDLHVYMPERQPQKPNPCGDNNGGCSHLCLLTAPPANFACACPTGVRLLDDGRTCADCAEEILLLARRRDIRKISLDTPDYTDVIIPVHNIKHAIAIDYDPVDEFVYWTDDEVKAIRRCKLDGSESEYIITGNVGDPDGIAIDWVARNMYWTDTGTDKIEVSRLNGSSRMILIDEFLDEPRGIVVDPSLGLMFWTDWGVLPKIERAALDGSDRVVLVNSSVNWPNGIAVDSAAGKIYWGDGQIDKIEVMDINGQNRRVLVDQEIPHIFGFSLLGDYIYWTDWQSRSLERVHKVTGLGREVIIDELPDVMGLKAVNVKQITRSDSNPCTVKNGGCSHLCFYRPSGAICACPSGHELLPDDRNCIVPEAFLLFCINVDIRRISLEANFNDVDIPLTGIVGAVSLDFDITDNRIYWSDYKLKKISKAFMNATGREDVIEFGVKSPEGIAVDWVAHNIYFTDSSAHRIEVARLDGSARKIILWQNIDQPRSIAIDPNEGFMYWSDWAGSGTIERAFMDGTRRKVLLEIGRANGLTIDYGEKRLYWAAIDLKSIYSSDLLGQDMHPVVSRLDIPFGITQYREFIYWADWQSRTIERANKVSGENRTTIHHMDSNRMGDIMDLLVFHSSRQSGWNHCAQANGECEYLCLSRPNETETSTKWSFVCACPTHYTLNEDGKTCSPPESFLLVSLKTSVIRMPFNYPEEPEVVLPIRTMRSVKVIDFDPVERKIYWIDGKTNNIRSSKENGVELETVMPSFHAGFDDENNSILNEPIDIAIDPYSRTLFFTDGVTNVINATRLDGTHIGVVVEDEHQKPRSIALLPEKGLMFWVNFNSNSPSIERASMDGTDQFTLFSKGLGKPQGLIADPSSELIFWVDTFLKKIESAGIDGSNRWTLADERNSYQSFQPFSLCVDGQYLYWTDKRTHRIGKALKTTGKNQEVFASNQNLVSSIVAVGRPLDAVHPCKRNNGGCSHLCLAKPDGTAQCSCPQHLVLLTGDRECGEPPTCSPMEFLCLTDTSCLPLSWICDNSPDCADESDEFNCPYCDKKTEFRCEAGNCIDKSLACDGKNDCTDESDERLCREPCKTDQYRCSNGECLFTLGVSLHCNGKPDCMDGSDERDCEDTLTHPVEPAPKNYPSVPNAVVGSLVSIGFISLFVVGVVLLVRRCPCHHRNSAMQNISDDGMNSHVFQLNHLGGEYSAQKYLTGNGRTHLKSTNLQHSYSSSKFNSKSGSGSSSGLYDRARPTGASSVSSGRVSSSNCSYPKETLNPPPSPVTERSHCTTEIYCMPPQKLNSLSGRSYKHYKIRNIPPPPTPCSTDVCEDSEPTARPTHHKHTRKKRGYTNIPNTDPINIDCGPYCPPPTPQYLSDSCPPSPSTGRSCFDPYPPPPSLATDSS